MRCVPEKEGPTLPSTLKAVLPPAAPNGVTPSHRWPPTAQNPGQGLLKEKAGFCRGHRGRGQVLGTEGGSAGILRPNACASVSGS